MNETADMKHSTSLLLLGLVACQRARVVRSARRARLWQWGRVPTGTGTVTVDDTATTGERTASSSDTGPVCPSECLDPMLPVCDPTTGMCVPCNDVEMSDEACATANPEYPLCAGGPCVQCTAADTTICSEQDLLCDVPTGMCVPCTEHQQCEVGACALAEGKCFPADAMVLQVDGDGGQDYTSVGSAVNAVAAGGVGVIVVHEIDGGEPYLGAPRIAGGKTIAVFAAAGEQPILQGTGGNPGLRVEEAETVVYVDGLGISLSAAVGLRVTGATAWVDRSRIVQNTGGGIVAEIDMETEIGAVLTLRNSFVGDTTNDTNALTINEATAHVLYTTLGSGYANFASVFPVSCTSPVGATVRNGLLVSFDDAGSEISCMEATVTNMGSETMIPSMGNIALGDVGMSWFVDYGAGDFHLDSPPPELADVAQWQIGDPTTDIDGDNRPDMNGDFYAGADVP